MSETEQLLGDICAVKCCASCLYGTEYYDGEWNCEGIEDYIYAVQAHNICEGYKPDEFRLRGETVLKFKERV